MKLAFTLATSDYLPQANAVGESYLKHNTGDKFIIYLLDKLPADCDLTSFDLCEIQEIDTKSIKDFDLMLINYTLFEVITAIRPTLALMTARNYPQFEGYVYLDSDMLVYSSMCELDRIFAEDFEIILSTHFFKPLPRDGCYPDEKTYFNCGLHNSGFFAYTKGENALKFLFWWEDRLKTECKVDFSVGLFVDQIWLNFVPQFFEKVNLLRHPGYNVGYWNFHERTITSDQSGRHMVNGSYPLVLFHFSGFDLQKPNLISKFQNRYQIVDNPIYLTLFTDYKETLILSRRAEFEKLSSYYLPFTKRPSSSFFRRVKKLLQMLFKSISKT